MRVELQAAIEVRAGLDRALAPRPPTAPLWRIVRPLSSTASSSTQTSNASTVPPGKKWPTLRVRTTTSTPHRFAAADGGVHLVERRDHLGRRSARNVCAAPKFIDSSPTANVLASRGSRRRRCARRLRPPASPRAATRPKTSTEICAVAQEVLHRLELLGSLFTNGQRGVRGGEAVRVDLAVLGRRIVRRARAACGSRRTSAAWAGSRTTARPRPRRPTPASCRSR